MINDFSEIKNEKDRAIYAQCREILDSYFIDAQNTHEKKDHLFHECWAEQEKEFRKGLDSRLDGTMKFSETDNPDVMPAVSILGWIIHNEDKLMDRFQSLIILREKLELLNKKG